MKIALITKSSRIQGEPNRTVSIRIIDEKNPRFIQDLEEDVRKFNLENNGIQSSMKIEEVIDLCLEEQNPFGDILDDLIMHPQAEDVAKELEEVFTKIAIAAYNRGDVHGHNEAVMER